MPAVRSARRAEFHPLAPPGGSGATQGAPSVDALVGRERGSECRASRSPSSARAASASPRSWSTDISRVPELRDVEFALTDISEHNLSMVQQILDRMVEANDLPTRITATTDRRAALEGARYVISCVRVGGLEAYADDIRIPLKYGVDQCVGDTICAGGILYGQRNIPVILDFCSDIREVAEPRRHVPELRQPDGDEHLGGDRIWQGRHDRPLPRRPAWRRADRRGARRRGRASSTSSAPASTTRPGTSTSACAAARSARTSWSPPSSAHPVYSQQEKVRIDVLKRFGFYSTEINGHLSEYLPWYRKRPEEIGRWIDMSDWIHGETGGYLRHSHRARQLVRDRFPDVSRRGRQADRSGQALHRACQPHPRGAGDRPRLSRPLQRQEQRHHHQPAGRRDHRDRPASSIASASTWRRHHAAGSLRRDLHRLDQCPAHGGPCGDRRRRRPAEAGRAARSAGRRDLLAGRGLADGRRDARRPGRLAAAIRRTRSTAPRSGCAKATVATRDWQGAARREVRSVDAVRAERRSAHEETQAAASLGEDDRRRGVRRCEGRRGGRALRCRSREQGEAGACAGDDKGGTMRRHIMALGGAGLLLGVSRRRRSGPDGRADDDAARAAEVRGAGQGRLSSAATTSRNSRRCPNITSRTG